MRTISLRLLVTLALMGFALSAQATLSCTAPISTGFSTAYAAAGVVPNVSQGIVTFNCTRSAAGDATSILLTADNGANATGVQNRARSNNSRILYEAYKDSACSAVWTSKVAADYWPVNLLNVLGTQSVSVGYWGCITRAAQVLSAGTYIDSVIMNLRENTTQKRILSNGTFPVSITSPATFAITAAPGDVAFIYTAFGPAVNASTTFVTVGSLNLPYTMALDSDSGVASGLNFGLNIDSQASPVSARGSGAAQTHTINGRMPAGQAGTCTTGSCSSTQVRTLTITY
jgi:hypothetical protein